MTRLVLWVLTAITLAGCSARSVVVKPEEVSTLNDTQWTIKSPPSR